MFIDNTVNFLFVITRDKKQTFFLPSTQSLFGEKQTLLFSLSTSSSFQATIFRPFRLEINKKPSLKNP